MKRLKIWSFVMLALLLSLQLTMGLSEAKTNTQVIEATGYTVSKQIVGDPKITVLPNGYTRIQLVEQDVSASNNPAYAKYVSNVYTVNVLTLLDSNGIPVVIKGTFHAVNTVDAKSGWNGTFEGKLGTTGVEIYSTGHGYGDLAAYKYDDIQQSDGTFKTHIYLPQSQG